jgi:hypothetical protein
LAIRKQAALVLSAIVAVYLISYGGFALAGRLRVDRNIWGTDSTLKSKPYFYLFTEVLWMNDCLEVLYWPLNKGAQWIGTRTIAMDDPIYDVARAAEKAVGSTPAGYLGISDGDLYHSKYRVWVFDTPQKKSYKVVDVFDSLVTKVVH